MNHYERFANVRAGDRAVVYYNAATGERKTPPRADQAMPAVYARQGFERLEIESMLAWEKQTGLVHEATNFSPGNEPSPDREAPVAQMPRELRESLINDIRDAAATGWTDDGNGPESFTTVAPL